MTAWSTRSQHSTIRRWFSLCRLGQHHAVSSSLSVRRHAVRDRKLFHHVRMLLPPRTARSASRASSPTVSRQHGNLVVGGCNTLRRTCRGCGECAATASSRMEHPLATTEREQFEWVGRPTRRGRRSNAYALFVAGALGLVHSCGMKTSTRRSTDQLASSVPFASSLPRDER